MPLAEKVKLGASLVGTDKIDLPIEQPKKKKKRKAKPKDPHERIDGDFQIVGCDLSLESPGFAKLQYNADTRSVSILDMGRVPNKNKSGKEPRGMLLARISSEMQSYILDKNVKVVAREDSFSRFGTETQILNRVNGVCEQTLWLIRGMSFEALAPTTVKKNVSGSGKGTKEEVAEAISHFCEHDEFETDDVSDAVAVALCFLIVNGYIDAKPLDKYADGYFGSTVSKTVVK